jgi:hypothetical protein
MQILGKCRDRASCNDRSLYMMGVRKDGQTWILSSYTLLYTASHCAFEGPDASKEQKEMALYKTDKEEAGGKPTISMNCSGPFETTPTGQYDRLVCYSYICNP